MFDLVLINPKGNPPVCKVMDYNKFKYENKKKEIKKSCNGKFAVIWIVWTIVVAIGITAFVLLENMFHQNQNINALYPP